MIGIYSNIKYSIVVGFILRLILKESTRGGAKTPYYIKGERDS